MTHIALVDDETNILTSVSLGLESEGFKVDTYLNGEEALVGLEKTKYDLERQRRPLVKNHAQTKEIISNLEIRENEYHEENNNNCIIV